MFNNPLNPLNPYWWTPGVTTPASRIPRIDIGGIYELCSTGIIENLEEESSVDYGVNPAAWKALPNEAVIIWKVRHPVTQNGASLPVNVVIPSGGSTSTVTSSNTTGATKKVSVVDNKSTQVQGSDVTVPTGSGGSEQQGYTTEHMVYINKCNDTFRLLGVKAQNSPTAADTPAAAKSK